MPCEPGVPRMLGRLISFIMCSDARLARRARLGAWACLRRLQRAWPPATPSALTIAIDVNATITITY